MVARDIVPFDTISVEIVQDSNADLVAITVIRLSFGSRFLSVISNTKIRTNPDYEFFLNLPSGMRPKSLASNVTFTGIRRPSDNSSIVINPASGPHVPLSSLPQQIHDGQGLLVGV